MAGCLYLFSFLLIVVVQPPFSPSKGLDSPHEVLCQFDEYGAPELTPMRAWELGDGGSFQGKLMGWSPADGIVVFRDQFNRPASFSTRHFSEQQRTELDSLVKPVHEARQTMDGMSRSFWAVELKPLQGDVPENSRLVDYKNGWVYQVQGATLFRTPEGFFDGDTITRLQREADRRKSLRTWRLLTTLKPIQAELIGSYQNDLVMRGMVANQAIITYRVPMSFFMDEYATEALNILAQLPEKGVLPVERVPEWWMGLDVYADLPIGPMSINQDQIQVVGPNRSQLRDTLPNEMNQLSRAEWSVPIESLSPEGLLFTKMCLKEKQILSENPSGSSAELQSQLDAFRLELTEQAPLQILSPAKRFQWVDCPPMGTTEAHAIAELPDHFVFVLKNQNIPFWVLKSEVPKSMQSYCSSTAKKMAQYYRDHPEAKPKLDSKFRLVRTYGNAPTTPIIAEPISIQPQGSTQVNVMFPNGGTQPRSIDSQILHPVDRLELKMIMEGTVPAVDSPAMSPDQRTKLQMIAELESLEALQEVWYLRETGDTPQTVAFGAAINRRYQDGFVFKISGQEFLVDAEMLDDQSRSRADKILERMEPLRKKLALPPPATVTSPKARLWFAREHAQVIGQDLRIEPGRSVSLTDLTGHPMTVEFRKQPKSAVVELLTQYEADQRIRSKKRELSPAELAELADLKAQLRKQFSEQLLYLEIKHFPLKDTMRTASGNFELFDGEDAILCDPEGRFIRVFQFALKDESLAEMRQMEKILKAKGKKSATEGLKPVDVKLRLIRGNDDSAVQAIEPGEPLEFSNGNLYVLHSSGQPYRLSASSLNREDWDAIRSMIYLKVNGIARDTGINERLRQPIKPEDVIEKRPSLSDQWKQKLDEFAKPISTNWSAVTSLEQTTDIHAISPDGSFVLSGSPRLRVSKVENSNSIEIDSQTKSLSHAYFADNNTLLLGHDGNSLKCWDVSTGKLIHDFESVKNVPLASCQSADGIKLFLIESDTQLLILDSQSKELQSIKLSANNQIRLRTGLWSSNDGKQFVLRAANVAQVFDWDGELKRYTPDYGFELPFENALIAVSEAGVLVADQKAPYVTLVTKAAKDSGTLNMSEIGTGLYPEWIGFTKVNGLDAFQVIGKKTDPFSQASPYLFSVCLGFDRKVARLAQTLDSDAGSPVLISALGGAAVTNVNGNQRVLKQAALSKSTFDRLERIAESLVQANDIGQIEATWNYLRRAAFHQIGEYPDHAAEIFLDYVHAFASNFQWQHGGKLAERHELLINRWKAMAPNSVIVPILSAMLERDLAWKARGTGFANTVAREGFDTFREKMLRIAELIKPILSSEDPPTRAYSLAYEVAMSLSLSLDVTKKFNSQMMSTSLRLSTSAHEAVVLLLLPRWQGNPGDSERYITGVARKLGGDEGDRMYMLLMMHAAKFYPSNEPASNYIDYDPERILRGLRLYCDYPQSANVFKRVLNMFATEERWDLYKQCLELGAEKRVYLDDLEVAKLQARLENEKTAIESK